MIEYHRICFLSVDRFTLFLSTAFAILLLHASLPCLVELVAKHRECPRNDLLWGQTSDEHSGLPSMNDER